MSKKDEAMLAGMCWRCTRCGWVDCYSSADLKEYGAPTECQEHYHESLEEISLAEGWAVLADNALVDVRKAERALADAKALATQAERNLALATAASQNA